MAKVKVSVVIPVYNTEKYVAATLHSIMEQDLKDIEVIVVDDGSTDNSYTILKTISIQDNRIRLLQQRNQGQGAARNLGMKYATGEYIYFMDSDDLLSRNAVMTSCLEIRLVNAIKNAKLIILTLYFSTPKYSGLLIFQ
jgi:glycosyltransferase involved in cell wall biosynthesis